MNFGRVGIAALVTCALTSVAEAGEDKVVGHVLAVNGDEIIVDLAATRGARVGEELELWRPLELRHPVTRRVVRDRFLIGRLVLRQVRPALAIAVNKAPPDHPPKPGDLVMLWRAPQPALPQPAATQPKAEEPAPEAPPAPMPELPAALREDPDTAKVERLFTKLRGASLRKRITAYEGFAAKHPQSRFAELLRVEARLLRSLRAAAKKSAKPPRVASFAQPGKALAGEPLTLAIELGGRLRGALLHTRKRGDVTYGTQRMKPLGRGYYAATLTPDDGGLAYFIEGVAHDGATVRLIGSAEHPRRLEAQHAPKPTPPPRALATAALWTDYADYNRLRGNDVAWQTEGLFRVRFGDTGVRALSSGFGVFRGRGGSIRELDELALEPRQIGLTYGYLEGEFGFIPAFSVSARAISGLAAGGLTGGGQLHVRIGSDLGTNLQLGGEVLGGVGLRGIAQFELNMFRSVPMMVRTEVTNQPAGTDAEVLGASDLERAVDTNDIGARGIVQVGYRPVDALVVAARVSFQGRTIKHSGPGFGGGVSYSW